MKADNKLITVNDILFDDDLRRKGGREKSGDLLVPFTYPRELLNTHDLR